MERRMRSPRQQKQYGQWAFGASPACIETLEGRRLLTGTLSAAAAPAADTGSVTASEVALAAAQYTVTFNGQPVQANQLVTLPSALIGGTVAGTISVKPDA